MVKSTQMLLSELSEYKDGFGKIRRMRENGQLFLIRKGLYETEKKTSGYMYAGAIYGPSYLSFSFALSYYSLIPERVYEYTSATYHKGKCRFHRNDFGNYSYRDIPKQVYPYEVDILQENGLQVFIATPDKALCDRMYELSPVKNLKETEALLLEDLRIDDCMLSSLRINIMGELSEAYRCNNVRFLYKFIQRLK